MKEESQIEDMRGALQGERERAERRSTENVCELIETSVADPELDAEPQPARGFLSRLLGR